MTRRIAVAIGVLALPLTTGGQSMGEAARKAKERREENARSGVKARSYTQDDVKFVNLEEEARKAGVPPGWLR